MHSGLYIRRNRKAGGFTLIELLVVIAIIALLSSIVLASLSSARAKAADVVVKQSVSNIRISAQQYFSEFGKYRSVTGNYYSGDCLTNSTMFRETVITTGRVRELSNDVAGYIEKAFLAGSGQRNCRTDGPGSVYMIAVQLKSSSAYWCVDNTGTSKEIATLPIENVLTCQ